MINDRRSFREESIPRCHGVHRGPGEGPAPIKQYGKNSINNGCEVSLYLWFRWAREGRGRVCVGGAGVSSIGGVMGVCTRRGCAS